MATRKASPHVARRAVLKTGLGAAAAGVMGLGAGSAAARSAGEIDRSVRLALGDLYRWRPQARALAAKSFGALVIPDILKAGFVVGAAYGEGALIVEGETDSYWSFTAGSVGLQAGAQRTRLAMFFMSQDALEQFLRSDGVEMGVDAEVTVFDGGADIGLDTNENKEIVAFVYGRAGLLGGASYSGGKYKRLDR